MFKKIMSVMLAIVMLMSVAMIASSAAQVEIADNSADAVADVAVVSSANRDAVDEEWNAHGLMDHVDIVLAQDVGSKAHCISEMLKFGYAPDKVLMVGDAPGDSDAADKNGVLYFPILVNNEEESWTEFRETALEKLVKGNYNGIYQEDKKNAFLANLGG